MNNIFIGSLARGDAIYDYSGIWSRGGGKISWKAVVRKDDVVCRPSGLIDEELAEDQVIPTITKLIDSSIDAALTAEDRVKQILRGRISI